MVSSLGGFFNSVKTKTAQLADNARASIASAITRISGVNILDVRPLSPDRAVVQGPQRVPEIVLGDHPLIRRAQEGGRDLGFDQREIDAAIEASLQHRRPDEDPFDLAAQFRNPESKRNEKPTRKREREEIEEEKHPLKKATAGEKRMVEDNLFGLTSEELDFQKKWLENFGDPAEDAILLQEIPEGRRIFVDGKKQHVVSLVKAPLSKEEPINPFTSLALSPAGIQNVCARLHLKPSEFMEIWTTVFLEKEDVESMIRSKMDEAARKCPDFLDLSQKIEAARAQANPELYEELSARQLGFLNENDTKIKETVDRFLFDMRKDEFLRLTKDRIDAAFLQEFEEEFKQ